MFNAGIRTPNQVDPVPGTGLEVVLDGTRKRVHYLERIYNPDVHPVIEKDKYVIPEEGELVIDTANSRWLIVKHVDKYGTWKSTLGNFDFIDSNTNPDYDLFPQHEYGFLQGELALMVDYTVRPNSARIDANAVAPNAAYAMLYKGSLIGEAGEVISATFKGGDFIDNRIPVVPVVYENYSNHVIMGTAEFSILANENELPNGSRTSLVFYDTAGVPIPPVYTLATQHCAYLRDHNLDTKYVKSIELLSPWFTNSTKPRTLFIAINLILSTVGFKAKVHYSDGTSSEELPVNSFNGNSGFRLFGIDSYKPTVPGQSNDSITLTYSFAEHERAMIVQQGAPRHISESYEIVATPAEGCYTPRIYTYPYWDPARGYVLKHFLTDLERKYCRDVTDVVTLNDGSKAFEGRTFGVEQPLIFNLNMRDVNASYQPWSFIQECTVTLYNQATSEGRKWDVRHSYDKPAFNNLTIEFKESATGAVDAKFVGIENPDDFVMKGYRAFEPMKDPRSELMAPMPTHFDIVRSDNTSRTGIPLAQFNTLPLSGMTLAHGEGIFIRWTKNDGAGTVMQLGVSAAVCKRIPN